MEDDQQFCLRWNNHQSTLISVFDTLLENQTLVDCTLAAEGKFLKAHKVVLSACSPFFATLLQQQYDKHPIFILKDVKYQELRAMMDYMYRGEVNISQDQLAALLKAAESLQIKGLSDNRSGNTQKSEQHRGLNVPGSGNSGGKLSGYTLEQTQTKRPRVGPSMETTDLSASREGSSSPSRRRRKVRRRSVENAMPDVHDNSSSSQMNQSTIQPQQQHQQSQQSAANLTGIGALTAATSSLPAPAPVLPTGSSGVLGATGSIVSTQGTTQQMTPSITKKTESVKGISDAINTEAIQAVGGVVGAGDEQNLDNLKGEKSNHKQKSSAAGVVAKETTEMVIEPKSEYEEEGNEETVEDLTLDDEEMAMEDLDQNAGTSQAGEGSSQGYAPWQHDRSQDELLLAPQEAQQRDPQGTSDGYWTILETVPYSLQNNATNTAGTVSSMTNTQMSGHHQQIQQSDEANSTETNLIASATVVVEIPTESIGNDIKYRIPDAGHQLIHSTEESINPSGSKQRIHIVKDVRLNSTVALSQQSSIAMSNNEKLNRTQTTQSNLQHHFAIDNCLDNDVVVQQHRSQRQKIMQHQQQEFIKIESIPEKLMLRNVIQYDSMAVNPSEGDIITADSQQVIKNMMENEKQHRRLQIKSQQQEILNNSQTIELIDKSALEAVSETMLSFHNQQELERNDIQKSQFREQNEKLTALINCPTNISKTQSATEISALQLQYVCNLCGKSYKIKGSLKRHKRYECGVAPTMACNFCPHKCKYKSDLRKHVSQKHAGQNNDSELLIDH